MNSKPNRRGLFSSAAAFLLAPAVLQGASAVAATPSLTTAAATAAPSAAFEAQSGPAAAATPPAAPPMQATADTTAVAEVVVTAQKRSQSLLDVPITITAETGAQLANRGVVDTADLGKVVPGFVFTKSDDGQPVYTLRGVGLYDSGLASSPAVSVYVDQAPLSFSIMTTGATLDLERVEVLKGPQGTLFGQNNTGGAVNFIAAKPTDYLSAGIDATYESFNKTTVDGFVSGPITPTLDARFSFKTVDGGAWQYSASRPTDHLGTVRQDIGRLLLDWRPNDRLKVSANINGWWDGSDTQAGQLQAYVPQGAGDYPQAADSPIISPSHSREANWAPDQPLHTNNHQVQAVLRADYNINDNLTLTSISDYAQLHYRSYNDVAADQANVGSVDTYGKIDDFNQELRLAGKTAQLNWVLGGDFEYTKSHDVTQFYVTDAATNQPFPFLPPFTRPASYSDQTHESYAIFGNAEYKITPRLTLQGGLRVTQTDQKANNCASDNTPGSPLSTLFTILEGALSNPGTVVTPIAPYACYALDPYTNFSDPGVFKQKLDQGNLSYRASLDYDLGDGIHPYVSVSRGYKAGIFTNIGGSSTQQFLPVKQERLDDYEGGIKSRLFDGKLQFNAAGFYYNYNDKQIRAKLLDPIFGYLETLVTVPEARIYGVDADFTYTPVRGLTLTAGGLYESSDIDAPFSRSNGLPVYDSAGHSGNFEGSQLPFTPHFTGNVDVDYQWSVGHGLVASVGAGATYHDVDNSTFQADGAAPDPIYKLRAYTLLDLRAGLSSPDQHWRVEVFGRNVTNEAYSTGAYLSDGTIFRYAGMPETYGVTLGYRF